jgi:hypothetical protein
MKYVYLLQSIAYPDKDDPPIRRFRIEAFLVTMRIGEYIHEGWGVGLVGRRLRH